MFLLLVFALCSSATHREVRAQAQAKTQIMLMNRAQPELEQVQGVLDFIIIKFLLSLKVPAQSYSAELVALK